MTSPELRDIIKSCDAILKSVQGKGGKFTGVRNHVRFIRGKVELDLLKQEGVIGRC